MEQQKNPNKKLQTNKQNPPKHTQKIQSKDEIKQNKNLTKNPTLHFFWTNTQVTLNLDSPTSLINLVL